MRRSTMYMNKDVTDEDDDEEDDDEEEEEEEDEESWSAENMMMKRSRGLNDVALKKGSSSSSNSSSIISCQAENCSADMSMAKRYHQRHKVCEYHAKAPTVRVAALSQRFCQQCSRFHEVAEFDEAKRSCRRRLAGHNQRRRKSPYDLQ